MIELTDDELDRVLDALAESSYYEPNHEFVEEVREMLLGKIKDE